MMLSVTTGPRLFEGQSTAVTIWKYAAAPGMQLGPPVLLRNLVVEVTVYDVLATVTVLVEAWLRLLSCATDSPRIRSWSSWAICAAWE